MDEQNTLEERTTIVGRPTYMVAFSGAQDAQAILQAVVATGYPEEDVSILLRPAGTDSAVDLLSGDNAAGQDTDAHGRLRPGQEATTLVLLHPEPAQLDAVRAALAGLGGKEFEYSPETVYGGEDSEADIARATESNVLTPRAANLQDAGGTVETSGPRPDRAGEPAATPPAGGEAPTEAAPSRAAARPEAPAQVEPLPDTSGLRQEIRRIQDQLDHVRDEIEPGKQ
jgi:hypothetical protein